MSLTCWVHKTYFMYAAQKGTELHVFIEPLQSLDQQKIQSSEPPTPQDLSYLN